jgi:DNA-binding MarR family transcriptional regulator
MDKFASEWSKEWPTLDTSHLETVGRIWRISEHLRRRFDVWLQPHGLNWETFDVIVSLRRSGAPYRMRPTELSEACLLTSGAMTNRLDRVERLGLIARRPAPNDRRSIQVELTPKGIALTDRVIQTHFAAARHLLECLGDAERQTMAHLLRKVLSTLEPAKEGADGTSRTAETSSAKPNSVPPQRVRPDRTPRLKREDSAGPKRMTKKKRANRPI